MRRRQFTSWGGAALGAGLFGGMDPAWGESFPQSDALSGVRTVLERASVAAVDQLGTRDGFLGNPAVRIELPAGLAQAAKLLKMTGQGRRVDELVEGMNRAAEQAVPQARALLVQAARRLQARDAVAIVRGGETSVTDYFERETRTDLTSRFSPIVRRETDKLDLTSRYNALAGKAAKAGLVKGDAAELQSYVTARAMDALYRVIGEQELRVRQDPLGTGSEILRKVFGR